MGRKVGMVHAGCYNVRLFNELMSEIMPDVDVIVVPQPSMDRVMKRVPEASRKVPILSSANKSVERLKEELDSLA